MNVRNVLRLAGCMAALTVAACAASTEPRPIMTTSADRWKPEVTEEIARLNLNPEADIRGLSSAERSAVAAFLRDYREIGHGRVVLDVPAGAQPGRVIDDVKRIAADTGVAPRGLDIGLGPQAPAGAPFSLSFIHYEAHVPKCGEEWPSLAQGKRSETYPNFGCATNANLAAMIADPADLLWPRETEPADAARRLRVLELYRAGEPTGAVRSQDESGEVAGIGN